MPKLITQFDHGDQGAEPPGPLVCDKSHSIFALRAGDCLMAIEVSAMDLIGRTVEDAGPYIGLCVGDGIYDVPHLINE